MPARSDDSAGGQGEELPRLRSAPTTRPRPRREGLEGGGGGDLSRDDLLFLLSVLEGELQARDEALAVLKADKMEAAVLEARYGVACPEGALRALQRDTLRAQACGAPQAPEQDVYEKPKAQLSWLVSVQRRGSRRMLEQLLEAGRAHRAFIQKSDDLTGLLEQDRERLKLRLVEETAYRERREEETAYRERREEESQREVSALLEELAKLKPFALLVVDEQRRLTCQLAEQSRRVQQLTGVADRAQRELDSALSRAQEEELKAQSLEAELRGVRLSREAMTAKLATEDAQNQQLRQRLAALCRQLDELEGTRGALRRAEEELQELRDRVRRRGAEAGLGEEEAAAAAAATSGLLAEVDQLRRRAAEMEGRDAETVRLGDRCRDLDRRLGTEASRSRSLKAEVERLNARIGELDRVEEALGRSRQEGGALRSGLEKERAAGRLLSGELEALRARVKELEAAEGRLERSEGALRDDLAKLRTLTMVLVEERKAMAERLRQAERRPLLGKEGRPQAEKLREERDRALKSNAELEERSRSAERERGELRARLRSEEERNGDLRLKVDATRRRLEALEGKDGIEEESEAKEEEGRSVGRRYQEEEDNKVKELSREVESLRARLLQKEVVEEKLVKAETQYESLGRRCTEEQERSRGLTEQLEEARRELSRYQLAEKRKDEPNQEHLLLRRLQEEQVKSRLLSRDVEALREKVQRLTGTEESISRVQTDHTALQRRLAQQEVRNRELAREMEALTGELDRYRRFSKSLRPGVNGRRVSDLLLTKEVQTEPEEANHFPPDYRSLAPMVANRKFPEADQEEDPNHNEDLAVQKNASPFANLNLNAQNDNAGRSGIPLANGKGRRQGGPGGGQASNANLAKQGDVVLTHAAGQPLHIKVTPDQSITTATLEISGPAAADNAASYTSTAIIPTTGAPPKQRITIIQNTSMSPAQVKIRSPQSPERVCSPDRVLSSLSRVTTPNSFRSGAPDHAGAPVQIVTVSTGSPDPCEVVGQALFRVTPERQPNGWHLQKSNGAGPSIITTEDNKIHIHLGSPYIQALNGTAHGAAQPGGPYHSPGQGARTLTNGCHVKSSSKITSSITITPATSPVSHPPHITIPLEAFRKPGPTRIPKPKGYGTLKGTNSTANTAQSKGQKATVIYAGKNSGQRERNRTNSTTTTTC